MQVNVCPTHAALSNFAIGLVEDSQLEWIASHLESCESCVSQLSQLETSVDVLALGLTTVKKAVFADSRDAEQPQVIAQSVEFRPSQRDESSSVQTVAQLQTILRESQLLHESDVNALSHLEDSSATDLATIMCKFVSDGKLTRFQASRLLQGKSHGWVLGDYTIVDQLGAGGMGLVFKAQHRMMQRTVAIKVVPSLLLNSRTGLQRFHREIQAVAKLRHPNIVTAFDAGQFEGVNYLVMELLSGETLGRRIRTIGPLPINVALEYMRQIAQGLAYAHQQGIVHRDVKPDNIWIEDQPADVPSTVSPKTQSPKNDLQENSRLKLLDFGLSHVRLDHLNDDGRLTLGSNILGTIGYVAPEQARDSNSVDPRSDIYSLGCTLWCMVTGEPPYKDKSLLENYAQHRFSPVPDLSKHRPDAPRGLVQLLQRMMAKNIEDRPSGMQALAIELDALLDNLQTSKPTAQRITIAPWLVLGAAILVVLLLFMLSNLKSDQTSASGNSQQDNKPTEPVPPGPVARIPFSESEAAELQQQWATRLNRPVEYRIPGVELDCVLIPAGQFQMGSPREDIDRRLQELDAGWEKDWLRRYADFEMTPHEVVLSQPYYIGKTEVTHKQFATFVESTGYVTEAESKGIGISHAKGLFRNQSPEYTWKTPGYNAIDYLPVTQVTWQDAVAFCDWISASHNIDCKLPTEAQWEFACRGGSPHRWYFGPDRKPLLTEHSNNNANGVHGPRQVAQRRKNPFGLYDMLGNVREWCRDAFVPNANATYASITTDPLVDEPSPIHTLRGGSFADSGEGQNCTSRQGNPPSDLCCDFFGFRIVINLKDK